METLTPSERAAVIVAVRRFFEANWAANDNPAAEPAKWVRLVELAEIVLPEGSSPRVDVMVGELVGALSTSMEWLMPHVAQHLEQHYASVGGVADRSAPQFLIDLLFVMNRARELKLEPDPAQRLIRIGQMQSAGIITPDDARILTGML